jgi:hypothetical protein
MCVAFGSTQSQCGSTDGRENEWPQGLKKKASRLPFLNLKLLGRPIVLDQVYFGSLPEVLRRPFALDQVYFGSLPGISSYAGATS